MKRLLAVCLGVMVIAGTGSRASAQVPPPKKDPVTALSQLLKDPTNASVRAAAARALTRLPNTKAAIPALIDALKDKDPFVRDNAVDALCVMAPGDVVPSLIRAMRDPDPNSKRRAADAVGRIKYDTVEAWPALMELLKDDNAQVRKAASAALRRVLDGKWD
jgi:HEAT repeat protein